MRSRAAALVRIASTRLEECLRIVTMVGVLDPAARLLPRGMAQSLATAAALPLLLLPSAGSAAYWDMRGAFGRGRIASMVLAWRWLARPFLDYLAIRRLESGRDRLEDLRVVQHGTASVDELRQSGRSFLVASVHGSREAYVATRRPDVVAGHIVQVGLDPDPPGRTLHDARIRIQYGTMVRVLSGIRPGGVEFVPVGAAPLPAATILNRLRAPGNVVMLDVDAAIAGPGPNRFERPFAGVARRAFSWGPARLAALAGCPVIACSCALRADGAIEVEWGPMIPAGDDSEATMNRLIDFLERRIGQRPTQYVRRVGGQRRWDPATGRWREA